MHALSPELDAFILSVAPPHQAVADAPNDWASLKAWADGCPSRSPRRVYADPVPPAEVWIPVWDGASDNSIYGSAEVNYAFRAWHDWTHLRLGLAFDLESERQVSLEHQRQAYLAGLSLEACRLLWIDTQGQNEYYARNGRFVENQRAFALYALEHGIVVACDRNL